jgi:hypothetical protein
MGFPTTDYGGATYEYGKQAALSTESAAYRFFRSAGPPTAWPSKSQDLVPQLQNGHALDVDYSDKGTLIKTAKPGAISFSADIRTGNAAGVNAPLLDWLESGGWSVQEASNGGAATTIAAYTDEGEFTLTDDVFGSDYEGGVILVLLNSGAYYPAFVYDYTVATKTCKLAMKLPSASQAGKAVAVYQTATPRTGAITVTDLLSFRKINRATYNAAQTGVTSLACALESIGNMVFDPAGFFRPSFTFTSLDPVNDIGDETLSVETLRGATGLNPVQGMELGFANASASAINNTQQKVKHAEINIKDGAVADPAEGDTSSVLNSNQGFYAQRPGGDEGRIEVTLTVEFARAHVDDYVNQQMKYFHALKTTTATTVPAWSVHLPRLEPVDYVLKDESGGTVTMDCMFKATSANYSATSGDNTEPGDRDIFWGVSDYA